MVERQLSKQETPKIREKAKGELSIPSILPYLLATGRIEASQLRRIYQETSVIHECVDEIARSILLLPRTFKTSLKGKQSEIEDLLFKRKYVTGETFSEVVKASIVDLLILNRGVILPLLTVGGKLSGFTARDASTFHPVYEKSGSLRGYIQKVGISKVYKFTPGELIYMKFSPLTFSHNSGYSIIESLTYEIASWLKNLIRSDPYKQKPSGVFVLENELGDDIINRFQEDLTSLIRGDKVRIPVIWGSKGNWVDLVKQFDVQMISSILEKLDWIVRNAFGFTSPSASLASPQSSPDLVSSSLVPEIARILEENFNIFLKNYGAEISFIVPPVKTLNQLVLGIKSGLIKPNEARQFMGLEAVKGGNELTILQPKGLTPVGKATQPPPQSPPPETKAQDLKGDLDLIRNLSFNDLKDLKNLSLLQEPAVAEFVFKRLQLVRKLRKDLRDRSKRFQDVYSDHLMLRSSSSFTPDITFIADVNRLLDGYIEPALDLGFERVKEYWERSEYPEDQIRKEALEMIQRAREEAQHNWNERFSRIDQSAQKGIWDTVETELANLARSVVAAAGFITFITSLPLTLVGRLFERSQGLVFRWVGIHDAATCTDCAALQGRIFSPSALELIQMWPGHGVRCVENCRCHLEPHGESVLSKFNDWIGKKISVRNLHSSTIMLGDLVQNQLKKLDSKIVKALMAESRLREPSYFAMFDEIKFGAVETPKFNLKTRSLIIPRDATAKEIREYFVDALSSNILTQYNLLNPKTSFAAELQALMVSSRKSIYNDYLSRILPKELKEAWLDGDLTAFKNYSLNVFDLPTEAYFDVEKFFSAMLKTSILSPQRSDIVGMKAFQELVGNSFWSPQNYETWLNRVYRTRPVPWRATLSTDRVLNRISFIDDGIKDSVEGVLRTFPALRVPAFWEGLEGIKLGKTSAYNASYFLEGSYDDFVKSFTGEIKATGDPYQLLHEIGHHVFERQLVPRSMMQEAYSYIYRDKILIPFYEQALPQITESQAIKFMGYMNNMLEASASNQLSPFLLGSRELFMKEIFTPIYPSLQNTLRQWSLPIRLYALQSPDETFAELFASYFFRPTVMYNADAELYVFMEKLLQNIAVSPEKVLTKNPLWQQIYQSVRALGVTKAEADKLLPELLKSHLRTDLSPEEMIAFFKEAAAEGSEDLKKQITNLISQYSKGPEKVEMRSTESIVKTSAKAKAVTPKVSTVTLKDISKFLEGPLKLTDEEVKKALSKIIDQTMSGKLTLKKVLEKLTAVQEGNKEAKKWLLNLLKK